jgi:hypothetical protein
MATKPATKTRARVDATAAAKATSNAVVEEATALDGRVLVNVPRAFTLTDDEGKVWPFAQGVVPMAPEHRDHWYSQKNGVTPFDPK